VLRKLSDAVKKLQKLALLISNQTNFVFRLECDLHLRRQKQNRTVISSVIIINTTPAMTPDKTAAFVSEFTGTAYATIPEKTREINLSFKADMHSGQIYFRKIALDKQKFLQCFLCFFLCWITLVAVKFEKYHKWNYSALVLGNSKLNALLQQHTVAIETIWIQSCQTPKLSSFICDIFQISQQPRRFRKNQKKIIIREGSFFWSEECSSALRAMKG